ncbi:MAG: ExbD/TolR family protein [Thermoguttaceae bacterium]
MNTSDINAANIKPPPLDSTAQNGSGEIPPILHKLKKESESVENFKPKTRFERELRTELETNPANESKQEDESGSPILISFHRRHGNVEMDMTPMVDVVFLLLIFFMITASFGMQKAIEIPDSDANSSAQQVRVPENDETNCISIEITSTDDILIEGETVSTLQELISILRDYKYQQSNRRTQTAQIAAASEASHGMVVRVIDAISATGIETVKISTAE